MFEVVGVGSDLGCLLIVLFVVLSDEDGGEGTIRFFGFVALEIVATRVDLIEYGNGGDLRRGVIDELP